MTIQTTVAPATTARRLLEEASRLGVDCIFTNLGSDHPAFIEAFAQIAADGGAMPRIIVCPHEMTALSAAHGYAMRKWSYEVRAAEMIDQVLLRGIQLACSVPEGPVYLTGAREVWDEPAVSPQQPARHWRPAQTAGVTAEGARDLLTALCAARKPLVITSYLGRQTQAVEKLAALSQRLGFAVCEVNPQYVNFPGDHAHHVGYRRNALVDEADLILMIDVDVPWIVSKVTPRPEARLFHLDCDPLKPDLGFWHFPAERSWQADSLAVLDQLLALAPNNSVDDPTRIERCAWIADARRRLALPDMPVPTDGGISMQQASEAIAALVNDKTVVVFEEPAATERLLHTLRMRRPGSYYANGGSGLGWSINAAIGLKLAQPDAEVITVVGDGSYLFGVPGSAYWVAETYGAPQLTLIFNNGGWNAPKVSTLLVHPDGQARRDDSYWVTVGARARLADIAAAASGAAAYRVTEFLKLRDTLEEALAVVRGGRCAVVDVVLPPTSAQVLGNVNPSNKEANK